MVFKKMNNDRFFFEMIKSMSKERVEEFRQYTFEIEGKFSSDKKALTSAYSKEIVGLSEDDIKEIDDYFSDDYYIIEEIHVGLYRKSTLVLLYSFLENSMNSLCRYLCLKNKYPVILSDLRGEGIVRAKDYLEKLADVDFSLLNGEWSCLMTLNKIRNCIVHSEGDIKVSKSPEQLEKLISNVSGLSFNNEKKIKVEHEYIVYCMDKIEAFFEKLYQQVFPK